MVNDFSSAISEIAEGYDKRKSNEYDTCHIISSITLNDFLIDLGEDTEHEQPFYVETSKGGENGICVFSMRTAVYTDALTAYTGQIQEYAEVLRIERNNGIEYHRLTAEDCLPGSKDADYTGQFIVVDSAALLAEYRSSESQLILCSHGNGARPNAIGRSVFATELLSGERVVYDRSHILGIADEAQLPQWAKTKLEIMRDKEVFEFGGYHFKPVRQFADREVDKQLETDSRPWKNDAQYAMRNMASDFSLGISAYDWKKTETAYSIDAFYAASGDSTADIFKCIENGKLYVPGENELFRYNEPPQMEKSAPSRDKPPKKEPSSLLDELSDAKTEASARNAAPKDNPQKKRGEAEL